MDADQDRSPRPGDHDPTVLHDGGSAAPIATGPVATRLEVPGWTFAKAAIAVLLILGALWVIRSVVPVLLLIILSLLLATVLDPLADRLQRAGLGRGVASLISLLTVALGVLVLLAIAIPPLVSQGTALIDDFPEIVARTRRWLARYPAIYEAVEARAEDVRRDPAELLARVLQLGVGVVSGIFAAVLIFTLTLYFLIDGERVRAAVIRHTPPAYRERMDRTLTETARVVRAYFVGQAIVSSFFAIFTLIVLTILGVPYPAVLAAMAFVLDAIPNIGATLATILPALVALSKSLTTAVIVAAVFLVYQQIENNIISPRILGRKLEVPPILTLIAILVGGQLLGVIGVILAIPLAGTLPVIDRIWVVGEEGAGPLEAAEGRGEPPTTRATRGGTGPGSSSAPGSR